MRYDVTIITVRPGTHPDALQRMKHVIMAPHGGDLLACWYSDLGSLNQILLIRTCEDEGRCLSDREATLRSQDCFGIGKFIVGMTMDTYVCFPFLAPLQPGEFGPFFEVRTYIVKPDGLQATIALWRDAVPRRASVSPLLTAMHSVTGQVTRFMHIWPYPSLDERQRLRAKAVTDGVWPPAGGPDQLVAQQADIFLPAPFSPMR